MIIGGLLYMKWIQNHKILLSLCVICLLSTLTGNLIKENRDITVNSEAVVEEKSYIKWVEFSPTRAILEATANLDIRSHQEDANIKYNWIELLAYLATKYGGDFKKYQKKDLDALTKQLNEGITMEELTKDLKNYNYFFESYDAILNQYIGSYDIQKKDAEGNVTYESKYGLKAFSPIASGYSYQHYDDFGSSRSYGYRRKHLGHDMMGNTGTPIIATESGVVEALGWNQYGGWRIGIRSFDRRRYYYYAHLRKDHPFAKDLKEGDIVTAGDVIGYLGMTGYSATENVNNIDVSHLHFGIQLIFDESQKEGNNQIWIDLYELTQFLSKNRSAVTMTYPETKDYTRLYNMIDHSSWD